LGRLSNGKTAKSAAKARLATLFADFYAPFPALRRTVPFWHTSALALMAVITLVRPPSKGENKPFPQPTKPATLPNQRFPCQLSNSLHFPSFSRPNMSCTTGVHRMLTGCT